MEFNLYGLLMSQVEWIGGGSSEEVKAAAKTGMDLNLLGYCQLATSRSIS